MGTVVSDRREKVLSLIVVKDDDISKGDDTFRIFRERSVLGERIFKDLVEIREKGVNSNDERFKGFYLTSKDKEVGLMSQLFGVVGLLSLIIRYNIKLPKDKKEKEKIIGIIKESVSWIIKYIDDNGYDLSPYLDSKTNKELFRNTQIEGKEISYIGARTWALSMFVSARKLHRLEIIDFSDEMDKIKEKIKENICFFIDNVVRYENKPDGKPLGWGYANGCETPSLFFTYSVIEAFTDFDDNCIIDDDDNVGKFLNEFASTKSVEKRLDDDLLKYIDNDNNENKRVRQLAKLCVDVGDRAWELFGGLLEEKFLADKFDYKNIEDIRYITKEEIRNSSRSSVLFNNLYIILILFYTYKNKREGDDETLKNQITSSMSKGLQLIQTFYTDLQSESMDSIVDMHIIAFDQKFPPQYKLDKYNRYLNNIGIQASSLLPMLVKAQNLMAYHVYKYPRQEMSQLLDRMLSSMLDDDDDKFLWENQMFDLLSTERYIEAVADFYDYYDDIESNLAENKYLRKKLEKEKKDEIEDFKRNMAKENESKVMHLAEKMLEKVGEKKYPVEAALNIQIEKNINEKVIDLICSTLKDLSAYNALHYNKKAENQLDENSNAFKLNMALRSYFDSLFAEKRNKIACSTETNLSDDIDISELNDAIRKDSENYLWIAMEEFFRLIANNKFKDSRTPLKDIFDLIDNKINTINQEAKE